MNRYIERTTGLHRMLFLLKERVKGSFYKTGDICVPDMYV